jgi:N-acetylglucosaminyldiphosphoundecaprenol N-acetyl-beta-D-mannosaminyltransferase
MNMSKIKEYVIYNSTLENIDFKRKNIINTINPHSFCVAEKDLQFRKSLVESDILLPDGIGIVWAEMFLNRNSIKKIAGYDLFLHIMKKMNKEKGSVFFLGASNETLNKIKINSNKEFPNVIINSYSPPYKDVFSEEESKNMYNAVNAKNPDVLFVGMTAPKQEKWVYEFQTLLSAKTICSIGAVFDFYSGNVKRSSPFWISIGFEWLPRLLKEPKRLFYRNFISTPNFILKIFWLKIFKKK